MVEKVINQLCRKYTMFFIWTTLLTFVTGYSVGLDVSNKSVNITQQRSKLARQQVQADMLKLKEKINAEKAKTVENEYDDIETGSQVCP